MMRLAYGLNELNFALLMEVYMEGNMEKVSEGLSLAEAEQDFYAYLHDGFFRQKGAVYCVWEENGTYRSALRLEPYKDGWLLEALETAPPWRRRGYAGRLVREILALPEYEKVYSHVHKRNTPSLRLHERCGFRRVQELARYIDGSVNSDACTMLFQK